MSLLYLGHVSNGVSVVQQLTLVHFDFAQSVNGQQKLALMGADPSGLDPFHQFGMLVDEPGLAEDVCSRVFQLPKKKNIAVGNYVST